MNPQLAFLITSGLSLAAAMLPDHPTIVKLSEHSADIVQTLGGIGYVLSSIGLFIAKPHPQARAIALRIAARVRAWVVPRVFPPSR